MTKSQSRPYNTLAICTYNRADSLRRTLRSVDRALAHCDPGDWEVLVVDNNSSDHTADTCLEFETGQPLRYVFETEQGLSNARNRALTEARGRFLVFTDDDVVVDENWLAEYARCQEEFPDVDFFGGKVVPLWEAVRPGWLKDEKMPLLSGLLVNYDLGEGNRRLAADDPLPFGASFAVTRRLLEKNGRFRPDLGVKGRVPGRGEEADYLARARRNGFDGGYLATTVCHHPVDLDRLTLSYMYRYGVQKGIAEVRMGRTTTEDRAVRELVYGVRGLAQLIQGRGDRFRQCVINMGIQRGLRLGLRGDVRG